MTTTTPIYAYQDRFVGRDEDREALKALLDDGTRRVGVYGAPGVGKSRLAAEIAALWRDTGRPVAFVEGRSFVDAASLLDALVTALDLPPITEFDDRAVSTQIAESIKERKKLLLVIDGVEALRDEIGDLLAPILDEVNAALLLTSRSALEIRGLVPFGLTPLSKTEAVQLFVERARQRNPGFDLSHYKPTVIESLVERLDGLPLAIELAAARLTILSPEALLERLDQRFQVLRPGRGAGSTPQMALGEAIAISWEMLDDLEQAALCQCAVFEGGFALDAAEAVVSLHDESVWVGDILQSLVLQSLISTKSSEAGDIRFHMLESIRDFARRHGESAIIEDAGHRQAHYFCEQAAIWSHQVAGHDGSAALDRLGGEVPNLLAAVDRWSKTQPQQALQLLCSMEPIFEVRGLLGAYLERIDDCRRELTHDEPAQVSLTRASLLRKGGRLESALAAVDRARESADDRSGQMLLYRGRIVRDLGRLDEAREHWEQALGDCDEPFWRFQIQNELGLLELNRARFGADDVDDIDAALERGVELLGASYEMATEYTHALYRARPTVGWALALHESGESTRALRLLEEELAVQVEAGYRNGQLLCEHHVAILCFYCGDYDRALEIAAGVDDGLAEAGLTARRARNTSYRAIFANAAGRLDEAEDFVAQALDASEHTGQEITALVADVQGAMIAWEKDDDRALHAHLDRGVALAKSVGSPGHASFLKAYQAFAMAREGHRQDAEELLAQAIEQLEEAAEYRRPAQAPRSTIVGQAWKAIVALCSVSRDLEAGRWNRIYDALESVESLDNKADDPLTAVACRHGALMAQKVRRVHGLSENRPAHILRIVDGGQAFQLDEGDVVDLSSRDPLRRVLNALVERARGGLASADRAAVVAAGWPDEHIEESAAANRVYATIRMLRNLGLGDVLITDGGGYRIADDVLVI